VRTERGDDVVIVLVGNKTDLAEKRCVPGRGDVAFIRTGGDRSPSLSVSTAWNAVLHVWAMATQQSSLSVSIRLLVWGGSSVCSHVSIEDAEAKAKEHDIMFIETSAKGGVNIKVRWAHADMLRSSWQRKRNLRQSVWPGAVSEDRGSTAWYDSRGKEQRRYTRLHGWPKEHCRRP
jgi:hypothetical protein